MLGLGSIKDRIATIGEGLKSQFTTESESDEAVVNLQAGAQLISHYQTAWRCIHDNAEIVAKQAEITDREVSRVAAEYDKQWRHVSKMSSLVATLPDINTQIQDVMKSLGQLENLFMEVEVSLLALEDTIDARDAQEKQLEQRFQLAIYQERRRQELEELQSRLELEYQKKLKEKEVKENSLKVERQAVFQAKFEEDMSRFAETGFLEVPLNRPNDVSLESIDLDADDQNLESFLKDDCPNLSPLPRDDVPVTRVVPVPGNVSSAPPRVNINVQTPSDGEPGQDSLYTTPDATLENITKT